jgi:anti-sigma regulatory factor (Ser/Thr protein kinase)
MSRTRKFPPAPESVPAARRFATEALSELDPGALQEVELMVSELATNCVRHAHTAFELTIRSARGRVRIEVTDRAQGTPTMRSPAPDEPTGRGLQIVNMLAEAWGVECSTRAGKTVWFTVGPLTTAPLA